MLARTDLRGVTGRLDRVLAPTGPDAADGQVAASVASIIAEVRTRGDEALAELTARFEQFGAAGWAGKIKPLSTATMAKRYSAGELDPKIGLTKAAAE